MKQILNTEDQSFPIFYTLQLSIFFSLFIRTLVVEWKYNVMLYHYTFLFNSTFSAMVVAKVNTMGVFTPQESINTTVQSYSFFQKLVVKCVSAYH